MHVFVSFPTSKVGNVRPTVCSRKTLPRGHHRALPRQVHPCQRSHVKRISNAPFQTSQLKSPKLATFDRPFDRREHGRNARQPLPQPTQGSSWGYLKVDSSETLSIVGDKCPKNGSKNDLMAPRTTLECPHEGPYVVSSTTMQTIWADSGSA